MYSALQAFLARQAGQNPSLPQVQQQQPQQQQNGGNSLANLLGRGLAQGGGSLSGSYTPGFATSAPSMSGGSIPSIGGTGSLSFGPSGPSFTSPSLFGNSLNSGGSSMFMNPWGALAAVIAANEITAHGTSRRPDGTLNQIGFDLMGKAPAADIHALSDKWNLGDLGNMLEGGAKVGASIDPRDWWDGSKQMFKPIQNVLSKIF